MTKRLVYFFYTAVVPLSLLTSCNERPGRPKQTVNTETPDVVSKHLSPALNEYQAYLLALKPTDINTVSKAAEKYHALFTGKDAAVCDTAFTIFNIYHDRVGVAMNAALQKDTTDYSSLYTFDSPGHLRSVPPQLQAFNDQLHLNGFTMREEQGAPYIAEEGDSLKTWFYSYISAALSEYLDQVNKETKEPFSSDAAMLLQPKAYVDRIVWWERFMQQHPGFLYEENAKGNKQFMLTCLLEGMDNTPLTADEGTLQEYYKTAYDYLKTAYPETETNKIVAPYSKAIQTKNYITQKALLSQYKQKGYIKDFGG